MDINKLVNSANGELQGTSASSKSQKTTKLSSRDSFLDKVSLQNAELSKNEKLFAKLELEKLNRSSFDRLKDYQTKLTEFEEAKNISSEAAQETEIGQKINDPDVWSVIAQKILGQ